MSHRATIACLTGAGTAPELMAEAVLALEAGCDVLLFPKDPRAIVRSVAAWARTGGQAARAPGPDSTAHRAHRTGADGAAQGLTRPVGGRGLSYRPGPG